jgi:RNA polymerase sigma factor (sigma-70 family)
MDDEQERRAAERRARREKREQNLEAERQVAVARRAARWAGASREDAPEIAHDVVTKLGQQKAPIENVDAWLRQAARHAAIDRHRKDENRRRIEGRSPSAEQARVLRRRPGQQSDAPDGGIPDVAAELLAAWGGPSSLGSAVANEYVLRAVVESLAPDDRVLALGYFAQGRPAAEIADTLGVSTDTVYKRAERLRTRLLVDHGDQLRDVLDRSNGRANARTGRF